MGLFPLPYQNHVFCAPRSDCTKHCLHSNIHRSCRHLDRPPGPSPASSSSPVAVDPFGKRFTFGVLAGKPPCTLARWTESVLGNHAKDGNPPHESTMDRAPLGTQGTGHRAQGTGECSVPAVASPMWLSKPPLFQRKTVPLSLVTCAESFGRRVCADLLRTRTAYSRALTPCWPLHRCTRWRP
jgi:hypothetical protein